MKNRMHQLSLQHAFFWNVCELWGYHLSLLGFQTWLYTKLPQHQFGLIGIWFSCLYLLIPILLSGLETFATSHVSFWSSSKNAFYRFFSAQIPSYSRWIPFIFIIIGILSWYYEYPYYVSIFLCAAVFAESLKRCAKQMCYYLYAHKTVARAELSLLWIYILSCTSISLFIPLQYSSIIVLHGVYTMLGALMYVIILKAWYTKLPEHKETSDFNPNRQIWHSGYTFLWLLTSPNAYVLYTAAFTDVATAGLCKLLFSYSVTLERLFASSYAELKGIGLAWNQNKKEHIISDYDFLIVPFCTLVAASICFYSLHISNSTMCAMLLIAGIDSIILPLEKMIIAQNNIHQLVISRALSCTVLISLIFFNQLPLLLGVIISSKITSTLCTLYFYKYYPKITSGNTQKI